MVSGETREYRARFLSLSFSRSLLLPSLFLSSSGDFFPRVEIADFMRRLREMSAIVVLLDNQDIEGDCAARSSDETPEGGFAGTKMLPVSPVLIAMLIQW